MLVRLLAFTGIINVVWVQENDGELYLCRAWRIPSGDYICRVAGKTLILDPQGIIGGGIRRFERWMPYRIDHKMRKWMFPDAYLDKLERDLAQF